MLKYHHDNHGGSQTATCASSHNEQRAYQQHLAC